MVQRATNHMVQCASQYNYCSALLPKLTAQLVKTVTVNGAVRYYLSFGTNFVKNKFDVFQNQLPTGSVAFPTAALVRLSQQLPLFQIQREAFPNGYSFRVAALANTT